jgi:hypothetical protein
LQGETFGVVDPPSAVFLLEREGFLGMVNGLNIGGLKQRSSPVEDPALHPSAWE